MRIAMAQINTTVGDLEGNAEKIREYIKKAKTSRADLVAFPELTITGYPPQDLLFEKSFIRHNKEVLRELISSNRDIAAIVGFVDCKGRDLYDAAAVFSGNEVVGIAYKALLPTYDVFDEDRYFKPVENEEIMPLQMSLSNGELKLGVEICEDLWDENYDVKVTDLLAKRGADIVINISASPFSVGKKFEREKLVKGKSRKNRVPMFYINLVGGQDEIVFDGRSLAVDRSGELIAVGKQFKEELIVTDIDAKGWAARRVEPLPYNKEEEILSAIVLGIRDYFMKTGFERAIVGMSGGIDSSLTTCIAVEALGKENVVGISMPSKFSSENSRNDAGKLAENLGIPFVQSPIQEIIDAYRRGLDRPLDELRRHFNARREDDDPVADENIQPRVRANCLMDISNRLKDLKILMLNTGNKTELALGYCTLYGDMSGGIGALGDVSKLEVYELAKYVNEKAGREIIPWKVLEKSPSPELKEGQFDPFDFNIVSPLVDEIIENRRGRQELVAMGFPESIVEDTYLRIRNAEYKRRQAAPCIKITQKAFGIGWKMPIVNKYL